MNLINSGIKIQEAELVIKLFGYKNCLSLKGIILLINISRCDLCKSEGFFLGEMWPSLFLKQQCFFKSFILWAGSDFPSNKNITHELALLKRMRVIKFYMCVIPFKFIKNRVEGVFCPGLELSIFKNNICRT